MTIARGTSQDGSRRAWILACALVMMAGWGVRLFIHTRTSLTPSIDGAYYAVQPRALLEHGTLAYPDMPLKFALDAAITFVLRAGTGWPLEDACMRASQATDCLLPPLIAVPVFLIGASRGRRRTALWVTTSAAAFLTVGGPALRMTGDFQKNALALVAAAAALQQACTALAAWDTDRGSRRRPALTAAGWLAVATLTHAATGTATAVNLLFMAVAGMAWLPRLRRAVWSRQGVLMLLATVAFAATALLTVRHFDPVRAGSLTEMPGRLARELSQMVSPQPGRRMSGSDPVQWLLVTAAAGVCVFLLVRRDSDAPRWARAAGVGCGCITSILMLRLFEGMYPGRLAIQATLPGAMVFILALADGPASWRGRWPAWALMLATLATAPPSVGFASRPAIEPDSLEELRSLRPLLPADRRCVLLARHGLEFWANFALDVHTQRTDDPTSPATEVVLLLTEVHPADPGAPHGPRRDPPAPRAPSHRLSPGPPPTAVGLPMPPVGSVLLHEGPCYRLHRIPPGSRPNGTTDDAAAHD